MQLYLHQKEVAQILGITPQAVHKLLKDHDIPTVPLGKRLQVLYPPAFRQLLSLKGVKIKGPTAIGVHIVKGGVGKTTLTHALATRAAALGHRVLAVDLDQQANLSHSFNVWPKLGQDPTLLSVYEGNIKGRAVKIQDAIVPLSNEFHILPANLSLANLESSLLMSTDNLSTILKDMFEPIENNYDVIFFDCPPALGKLTAAVQCYANHLILPVNPDAFSLEGLDLTLMNIERMKKNYRARPKVHIVVNKFDARHKIGLEILRQLHDAYDDQLCDTFISVTKQVENSIAEGNCVWDSRKKNQALDDMHDLLIEVLDLEHWQDLWKVNKLEQRKSKRDHEVTANA